MAELFVRLYNFQGKELDRFECDTHDQAVALIEINQHAIRETDGFKVRIEDAAGHGCWMLVNPAPAIDDPARRKR